jgi:8-oxo-dGTP pyrophosphatase MutT (NUDIX family)
MHIIPLDEPGRRLREQNTAPVVRTTASKFAYSPGCDGPQPVVGQCCARQRQVCLNYYKIRLYGSLVFSRFRLFDQGKRVVSRHLPRNRIEALMFKNESLLARLTPHVETILHGEVAKQFGAICFRSSVVGSFEVLLITTRDTHRWVIPKGWAIKGLRPHETAEREAWEEAGVKGKVKKKPFGYYTYLKILDYENTVPSLVEVHLLEVEKVCSKFPERKQRTIEWMSPSDAAARVQEPELKGLLARLAECPPL